MVLSLVSRGVVSGLCLVFAKYWYDRREQKQQHQAADNNGPPESAPGHAMLPSASAAVIDFQTGRSASSATSASATDARAEDTGPAQARVSATGATAAAAAGTVSGNATKGVVS